MAEYTKYPVAVARAVIFNGKFLLFGLRRDCLRWEFPGGKIEHMEEPHDAAKRETLEECGLELSGLYECVGYATVKHLTKDKSSFETFVSYSEFYGVLECREPNHADWEWFSLDHVLKNKDQFMPATYKACRDLVPEFLKNNPGWPPKPLINLSPCS